MFVYCADVPAESYKLPSHRQCVAVRCNTARPHLMIKSKFSSTGIFLLWFMTLTLLLMSYLAVAVLLHFFQIEIVKTTLTNPEFIIVLLVYPLLIFIASEQIKMNSSIIYVNPSGTIITFKNYFTRYKRVYLLNEFEGYIDTLVESPRGDFRVLYLVRNNKLTNKMSGRIYSNLEEIEQGLTPLKYLGFRKFSLKWSLNVFFNRTIPK